MILTNNTYDIIDRTIVEPLNVSTFGVVGDANSRKMEFRISRYVDGTDLSTRDIFVCFKDSTAATGETEIPVNDIKYSNNVLSFLWSVPPQLTSNPGDVELYVEFRKIDISNNREYRLKTKTLTQAVLKSFAIDGSATSGDYTFEDAFLKDNQNRVEHTDLFDADIPFKVVDRDILFNTDKVIAVLKDSMSQVLTFRIKRYIDGIDRSQMTYCFPFINADGESDISNSCNVFVTEDEIFVGWALDSKVTKSSGQVTFELAVFGKLADGSSYKWYTKPSQFNVDNGLDIVSTINPPSQSWYASWVIEADNILKQSAQYCNDAKSFYYKAQTYVTDIENNKQDCENIVVQARQAANDALDAVSEVNSLYAVRENKDSNGIWATVKYYRPDDTLYMTSTLSGTNSVYNSRTEQRYELDGTTVKSSVIYPITFDGDGAILGRFYNLNQILYHGLL